MSSINGDLTTRARIRNAALAEFAATGLNRTTIRAIAARAEVSPALVIHHFGSKDGLRAACDEHLLHWLRTENTAAFAGLQLPTRAEYMRAQTEFTTLYGYLRCVVTDGGPAADQLFDQIVDDTESFLALGEEAGTVRPSPDPRARAVISSAIGLGLLAFDEQIARHLGGKSLLDPHVLDRYIAYTLDLYTHGMLTTPITFANDPETRQEDNRERTPPTGTE
ncbi:transcriptional regulator, TetR family [Austwickia chelonae]|uniref:Putative TetR family transcriptional regulator n=1 Tax=Austwickia chelonae NBRC 105200 TaxID=1184607 RepID=K6WB58_9MICO|nr:TetR family transcriptional regulator [Austwickia chelonae]GAB79047.1 putative TetR family transcriptional regulator [Austwickia chelonae NBRC 105200]SEW41860.1 transcriptional regulator, TetR family [Austwickia chelonae]